MSALVFETKTRLGPRRYSLEGGRLKIAGEAPFKKLALDVDLKDVAPHFSLQRLVAFRFIRNSMLCICAIVLLASLLSHVEAIPTWALLGGTILLASGFVREIGKWCRPIDIEAFRSHAGVVVFEVWREKGYEKAFDEFIGALHAAVLASQPTKGPNQSPEPTVMSVTPPAAQEPRQP